MGSRSTWPAHPHDQRDFATALASFGQNPRSDVWGRIWWNAFLLGFLLAVMLGLDSSALLLVDGGLVFGVSGPVLMSAAGWAAVRGYRRRAWPWLLGSIAGETTWFGVLVLPAPA